MKKPLVCVMLLGTCACVLAKLPALGDEAKAKAAEAAAKSAWSAKVDNYLLCKSQDKVATTYTRSAQHQTARCGDQSRQEILTGDPCHQAGAQWAGPFCGSLGP